jgi:type II secretion system protein N
MSFLAKNKKLFWLLIYFILVTVIFLFLNFPSESVKAYVQSLAEDKMKESDFSLEKVSLSLPFGCKLRLVELASKQGQGSLKLKAEEMTVNPDLWAMIKGKSIYHFDGHLYGGTAKGTVDFLHNKISSPYLLRFTLDDINFKSAQIVPGLINRDLDGKLAGVVRFEYKGGSLADGTGEAKLILSDGKAEVSLPLLDLNAFGLDRLEIQCQLNNKRLNLVKMEFIGPEIRATLSGSITLDRRLLAKSRINLKGEMEPLPEFFQKLGTNPSTMETFRKRLKNGKLIFSVNGTLDEPKMRIM